MRLALVTPLDARTTGVAEYSHNLLAGFQQIGFEDLQVFSADTASPIVPQPISEFDRHAAEFDLIIYQLGNSVAHDFMFPYLFEWPGLLVLHDLSLQNFFARQAAAGNAAAYYRALAFGDGLPGVQFARRSLTGKSVAKYPQYLASEWLLELNLGAIVHSQYAIDLLQPRCPNARLFAVHQPVVNAAEIAKSEVRSYLGIDQDTFLIVVYGFLNASKNPEAVLAALKRLREEGLPAKVVFIGSENFSFELRPLVERYGLSQAVSSLGFLDRSDVARWLLAADAAVGLRQLYFGETSASALNLLAAGLPLIVTRIGSFAELPDEACFKIDPAEADVPQAVYQALKQLALDAPLRDRMGQAARQYVMAHCRPDQVAAEYLRIAREIISV